jgi:signal transduction histidine kinase
MAVMLFLTLLAGGVGFTLTSRWEQAILQQSAEVSQNLMLTNIRWELREAGLLADTEPALAQKRWHEARVQLEALNRNGRSLAPELLHWLGDDANLPKLSKTDTWERWLPVSTQPVEQQLAHLQAYSRSVTTSTTACLLLLGFILMAYTVRDWWRLLANLSHSRDAQVAIQEEERRRIAQDLHDGVVQELVDLRRTYTPEKIDRLIDNIRRVCHNLKPQILSDLGLVAALEFLADDLQEHDRRTVRLVLDRDQLSQLPKRYELPLFRIVQELFSNIRHHAEATQASLTVVWNPQESPWLSAYVQDNGRGFSCEEIARNPHSRLGLTGVRERLKALNGQLTIDSRPDGGGTRISLRIPITTPVEEDEPHA